MNNENKRYIYRASEPDSTSSLAIMALEITSGLSWGDISSKKRHRHLVFCRMIHAHICRNCDMPLALMDIGAIQHRGHADIIHLLRRYDDLYEYDKEFRIMADAVWAKFRELRALYRAEWM